VVSYTLKHALTHSNTGNAGISYCMDSEENLSVAKPIPLLFCWNSYGHRLTVFSLHNNITTHKGSLRLMNDGTMDFPADYKINKFKQNTSIFPRNTSRTHETLCY